MSSRAVKRQKFDNGAAIATDAKLKHRSMRHLRAYATEDGAKPVQSRKLEELSTAYGAKKAAASSNEDAASTPEVQLREEVLTSMKEAGIRSLTKMQCRMINTLTGMERTEQVRRIVAQKLQDRQLAVALSLLQLAGSAKSRALPIVIASRSGANLETNSAVQGLEYLIKNKLKGKATAVVDGSSLPTGEAWKGGPLLVDASSLSELSDEHWKKCSHLIVYHEGGADSAKPFLLPSSLNPKVQKFAVVATLAQLSHPFVASYTGEGAPSPNAKAVEGRKAVDVQTVVCEGLPRLQALWTLLNHMCGVQRKKVAVCFNSREITSFHCDLFYALPQPEPDFDLLCDWETNTTNSLSVQQEFEAASTEKKGCVLLSAFGHTKGADVVVCYDPCPLSAYTARLSATVADSQRLVLFLYPSEKEHITASLTMSNGDATAPLVKVSSVDPPVATKQALTMMKVKAIVKKVFALAAKAFEGYKSTMAIYARLKPSSVYNIRALNLEKVSEQFGLSEVPMLDLRLKDNRYRPTEDYVRPARKRAHKELVELRKAAAERDAEHSESDGEADWGTESGYN